MAAESWFVRPKRRQRQLRVEAAVRFVGCSAAVLHEAGWSDEIQSQENRI